MSLASPPKDFQGTLSRERADRRESGRASGPIRLTPTAVARPGSVEDVAALVRWAAEEGVSLIPRGAGTGMPGGNVGRGVTLDLRAMDELEVDPAGRRAWVGPGVVGDRLDAAARRHGLFVPPLPSSSHRCTLGGMVANNAAGARTFGYGAVRDWVDALEVVLADGTRTTLEADGPLPPPLRDLHGTLSPRMLETVQTAWPRVRKNSSGYGLDRFLPDRDGLALLAGSEGTLGVVTRIGLRLAPLPDERAVALFPGASVEALEAAAAAAEVADAAACEFLGRRFLELAGLVDDPEVGPLTRGAEALVLVELDDRVRPVGEGLRLLRGEASVPGPRFLEARTPERREELWSVRHAASPVIARQARRGRVSMQFIEDSVVPRDRLGTYLPRLESILAEEETDAVMFGHAGDGNVHVNPLVEVERPGWRDRVRRILDATVELVAMLGGTLAGEHGDGRIRAPFLQAVWGAELASGFRTVKTTLDPDGILNPGVVVPLPGQDPLEGLSPEPRR